MDRLEQLKLKGWLHMDKMERAEYKLLKERPVQDEVTTVETAPAESPIKTDVNEVSDEVVTMKKSSLMKMMEDIKNDAKSGVEKFRDLEWQEYTEPKRKNYTATLRVYQKDTISPKGLIVDYQRLRTDLDDETKKRNMDIYQLTIRYDDGNLEKVEVPIREFVNFNQYETVEILEFHNRKMAMKQGEVNKSRTSRDSTGNEMILSDEKTGEKVPLMVLRDETECKVKRANGQVFIINVSRLNL